MKMGTPKNVDPGRWRPGSLENRDLKSPISHEYRDPLYVSQTLSIPKHKLLSVSAREGRVWRFRTTLCEHRERNYWISHMLLQILFTKLLVLFVRVMIELGFRRHPQKHQITSFPLPVGGDMNTASQPFTEFTTTSRCHALSLHLDL